MTVPSLILYRVVIFGVVLEEKFYLIDSLPNISKLTFTGNNLK